MSNNVKATGLIEWDNLHKPASKEGGVNPPCACIGYKCLPNSSFNIEVCRQLSLSIILIEIYKSLFLCILNVSGCATL